jgi:hypothetical protein
VVLAMIAAEASATSRIVRIQLEVVRVGVPLAAA